MTAAVLLLAAHLTAVPAVARADVTGQEVAWQEVASNVVGSPSASSPVPGRYDVVVSTTNFRLARYWTQGALSGWDLLPMSSPTLTLSAVSIGTGVVISRETGSLDVLAIGCRTGGCGLVHWSASAGGAFSGPSPVGGVGLRELRPAVTSWDATRLDVFAQGVDGRLKHFWRNTGQAWSGPEHLPEALYPLSPRTPPAALTPNGPNHVSAFVTLDLSQRPDGRHSQRIEQLIFTADGWQWATLGCGIVEPNRVNPPTATSWGPGRSDLFVSNGYDRGCHWWATSGDYVNHWDTVEQPVALGTPDGMGAITATSPAANRLDLFMNRNASTYQKSWTGTTWTPWTSIALIPAALSEVLVATDPRRNAILFAVDPNRRTLVRLVR
ncbi:hypothetical protein B0I31_109139 [Saccharothrix carnea]|uniref:PLL-like beta propeller domain-containing protein n=1 Tax=Saccharothrix carnea TaxID=1280637 RepID=A0A2P8I4E9_SACCR|nr:hypothetical protein [Saccharothrix carnea]PSL53349.1 hypothetical protein B0I31_109139 [Saccharothrix carnea]